MPWNQARSLCSGLNHNGSGGWTLPDNGTLIAISRLSDPTVSQAAGWSGGAFWSSSIYPDANNLPFYVVHLTGMTMSYLDAQINPADVGRITQQDIIRGWTSNYNNVLCVK